MSRTQPVATMRDMADEIERLTRNLNAIEWLTATGDGLTPDECIKVHLLAAEGRADDPAAWRLAPAARQRLYDAIKEAGRAD